MPIERRLVSYIAILIATIYYFFGRADAAMPDRPTVSGQQCEQAHGRMFECRPQAPRADGSR